MEKKEKIKMEKRQCNYCWYIDYLLKCPKCGGGMFKYIDRVGLKVISGKPNGS